MCSCTPKQFVMYTWASNVISDNFWKCMVCMEAHGVNIALSEVILCPCVHKKANALFPCTLLHVMVSCVHNSPTFFTDQTSKELTALKVLSESLAKGTVPHI